MLIHSLDASLDEITQQVRFSTKLVCFAPVGASVHGAWLVKYGGGAVRTICAGDQLDKRGTAATVQGQPLLLAAIVSLGSLHCYFVGVPAAVPVPRDVASHVTHRPGSHLERAAAARAHCFQARSSDSGQFVCIWSRECSSH
jgi:hypothetical protein